MAQETPSDESEARVQVSVADDEKDIFDDVFEKDEDEKAAKKKLSEREQELRRMHQKKAAAGEEGKEGPSAEDDEEGEEEGEEDDEGKAKSRRGEEEGDDEDDDGDDEEEEEEGEKQSVEPQIFGEVEEGGKKEEEPKSENNNTYRRGKGMGGKLEIKVTHDEEEEQVEEKAHPEERKVIKSVIKNKAVMAAKEEVQVKRGAKPRDYSKNKAAMGVGDEHDEQAEAIMREEGTTEEGIMEKDEFEEEPTGKTASEGQEGADGRITPELEFLISEEGNAFIGRKKSVLVKYGEEAGLFVGKVSEKDQQDTNVLLDGLNPHVVFVCGARGSGKSYVLGVIAEELALKNKNVGIVVVDPIGVFWSMKHPNKEEKELEALAKWGLLPRGLDNIKVFIPVGMRDSVPKSTYDAVFSIQPALLTADDWCLTFGIDRFSPTGLLMEKGIAKVKSGYETIDGKEVRGKQNTFSLDDLVKCFENDKELNDRDKGYKADSIRALVSRFDAAKHWGVFDDKGTSLGLLSRAGQMTILDTSFLEDNVGALVIGIISRRILAARKLGTRREAAEKFTEEGDMEELVELNIPPTWLFIDEAHTLIPGGNQKTPASNAIVEYVKQGRRPGCSLVFATQQPSAIDTKVLSQLDIIMAHKLVFDDDIKAIHKRTPAIVPHAYRRPNFIKTMPVGIALTGDRSETTSRAFIMSIRPRMSQHEGRDAETVEVKQELETDKVELLAVNIVLRQLEKDPSISIDSLKETLDTLNNTYKKDVQLEDILKALSKKGVVAKANQLYSEEALEEIEAEEGEAERGREEQQGPMKKKELGKGVKDFEEQLHTFEQRVELVALQPNISEEKARKQILGMGSKKFIFLEDEALDRIRMTYLPIYKVRFKYFNYKEAYTVGEAYINSVTGEFIHDEGGTLRESKGLPLLLSLSEAETMMLKFVAQRKRDAKESALFMKMEEGNAKRILDTLAKKGFIKPEADGKGKIFYTAGNKIEMDLPPEPMHNLLPSIGKRPIEEISSAAVTQARLGEKEVPELLKKLWGNVVVKEITQLFLPAWEGVLKKKTGEERTILIDAINGREVRQMS